jgi:hypothetical protein
MFVIPGTNIGGGAGSFLSCLVLLSGPMALCHLILGGLSEKIKNVL